jgi:hypothetical protein
LPVAAPVPALVGPGRANCLQMVRSQRGASYFASWAVQSGLFPPGGAPLWLPPPTAPSSSAPIREAHADLAPPESAPQTPVPAPAVPPLTAHDPHPSKLLVAERAGRGRAAAVSWSMPEAVRGAGGRAGVGAAASDVQIKGTGVEAPVEAAAPAELQTGSGDATVVPLDDGTLLFKFS